MRDKGLPTQPRPMIWHIHHTGRRSWRRYSLLLPFPWRHDLQFASLLSQLAVACSASSAPHALSGHRCLAPVAFCVGQPNTSSSRTTIATSSTCTSCGRTLCGPKSHYQATTSILPRRLTPRCQGAVFSDACVQEQHRPKTGLSGPDT